MKLKRFRGIVAVFSCFGLLISPNARASPVVSTRSVAQAPRDVALHEGGVLMGQALNAQGIAIAGVQVNVLASSKEIARVQTDKDGMFRVAGLTGGVHLVDVGGQQGVYRLWAPSTAPPAAQRGLMLVTDTDVVRGQCGCGTPVCGSPVCGSCCGGGGGGIGGWMANHPLITAGAIATAIAVPLAVDDDDDPPATP